MKIITVLFLAVLFSGSAFGQDKIYAVKGRLTDPYGQSVRFAHVVNLKKRAACITDTAGHFRMLVTLSDTVKISCIGFVTTGFSVSSLTLTPKEEESGEIELPDIALEPKIYELETISVYSERWKAFVYDWQQTEPEEEPEYVGRIEAWKENLINLNELQQLTQAANGIGIRIGGLFDRKRRKAMEKINEDKRQTVLDAAAVEKYNPKIVADITGMTTEEAEKFILHFRLDRDFILRCNDYDLYLIVKQLYKEYKK